jgi:O-antigen/teichoic acid export membrane protein
VPNPIRTLLARLGADERRTLAAGSASALVVRLAGVGATLAMQVIVARLLGVEGFGVYVYVGHWVGVLAVVASLGFDTSTLRFVASYRAGEAWGSLLAFVRSSLKWVAISSATLALGLLGVVLALAHRLSEPLADAFLAGALLLPALTLLLVASAQLRGLKLVTASMLPQWLLRPGLIALLALLLTAILVEPPLAWHLVLADAALTAGLTAALLGRLHRSLPAVEGAPVGSDQRRLWTSTSLALLALSGIRLLMNRTDVLMLGVLIDATAAGVYSVASQMAVLVGFGLMAVNMIAAPLVAELHSQGRTEDLQRLVTLASRGVLTFALVTAAALIALGPWLLALYGEEFAPAYRPLVLLTCAQVVSGAAGSVAFVLAMTGEERLAAWTTAGGGVLNVVLNALLIPRFGLIGAAAATATANVVWNLTLVLIVRRRLGLRPTAFGI